MRQTHHLKIERKYYKAVERGDKKFEIRRNDRNYRVGDIVYFNEVHWGIKTGNESDWYEIKYVMRGGKYGLHRDYVIFNF